MQPRQDTASADDQRSKRTRQIVLIQDDTGLGTGLLVSDDGWILTNKHVVPGAGPFRVVLADGRQVAGIGIHQSPHHDLAVLLIPLRVDSWFDLEQDLSDDYVVGSEVWAIGHPRGCRFSMSRGIVSNPHREFDKEYFVQTDVSINPGNSGGPLVDHHGRLVGIVSMMLAHSQGLGFAVPGYLAADYVRMVRRLLKQGVVQIPQALLEQAQGTLHSTTATIRSAIDSILARGTVALEEEKQSEGYWKLKARDAIVEVRFDEGRLAVSGQLVALGPSERANAPLLEHLLTLNGSGELGGTWIFLKDNALHLGALRSAHGLDDVSAFAVIDSVLQRLQTWSRRITTLVLGALPQQKTETVDPGYPLLELPTTDYFRR